MWRLAFGLMFAGTSLAAEPCPSFGFDSAYLSDFFCRELGEVHIPRTRTIDGGEAGGADDTDLTQPTPDWLALPVVREAWRSDPAKTLRLIERIRDAGGRPLQ